MQPAIPTIEHAKETALDAIWVISSLQNPGSPETALKLAAQLEDAGRVLMHHGRVFAQYYNSED